MKITFARILCLAFVLTGIVGMQSCIKEIDRPLPISKGMAEILFMARMPSTTVLNTRGETGTLAENKIDNIYVLSFKTSGELVYKGKAKDIQVTSDATNNNKVAFKATLPVGETYDLMVLANAEELLANISVGTTPAMNKNEVEALVLLQTTTANSDNGKWKTSVAIPMWGEQLLTLTASSNPTFSLMRMMARINVEYVGAVDHFQLTSIRYYNYNTAGTVIPTAGNLSPDKTSVVLPTLPDSPGAQTGESIEYTGITDYKMYKNQIYVFEAVNQGAYSDGNNNWINNPCLVVGGKYDSDKNGTFNEEPETWYRIDFIKKTTVGNVITEDWLSLLRNFSYNVVISSVSGDGYNDPDVALESVPMNMNAGVIDWNDGEVGEILVDGPNFLSVGYSRNEGLWKAASLYRNATSTDEIGFNTNIALDKFEMTLIEGGATIEPTNEERAAGVVAKIANEFYEVKIVEGDVVDGVNYGKFVFTALENYVTSNPVSTLTVVSGRIQYTISISQRDADPQDWNDGGNKNEILE